MSRTLAFALAGIIATTTIALAQTQTIVVDFDRDPKGVELAHGALIGDQYASIGVRFNSQFFVGRRTVAFAAYKTTTTLNLLCTAHGASGLPECRAPVQSFNSRLVVDLDVAVDSAKIEGRTRADGVLDRDALTIEAFDASGKLLATHRAFGNNEPSPFTTEGVLVAAVTAPGIRRIVINPEDVDSLDTITLTRTVTPVCGNGVRETGEECDDGNTSNTDACLTTCVAARCGDTFIRAGVEQCDDGNTTPGDGCSATCTLEQTAPACGNGVREAGEECDDGNKSNTDACLTTCKAARCGDGHVRANVEQCDDGNTAPGDGCSATCTLEAPPTTYPASVKITPRTLNIGSSGKHVNVEVCSPDGQPLPPNVTVDLTSLKLVDPCRASYPGGDARLTNRCVRFTVDRQQLSDGLERCLGWKPGTRNEADVTLEARGNLKPSGSFSGTDTIRVISRRR